uniref:Uncharacterized protein n=1 Tax=Octopus bimaculoides TaxID=37653 RepID=A0A0L8H834_OCTBM
MYCAANCFLFPQILTMFYMLLNFTQVFKFVFLNFLLFYRPKQHWSLNLNSLKSKFTFLST